ncbi:TetR/AcrR family transcriptional regulator [Dyella sp. EPa41]|uniref:TetR/AcrR family transcriptional regulator n=1 Tax=Dyella sp. EPa41 TaxID=1561194 RepID=UPI0019169E54|nr:TetR/AcrR family transcriptional regulator [Dyella sp. EPa41]
MARPRAFDRDQVLDIAIEVFRQKGFEGTSTDDLITAMQIGRQSLYATFGDKRSLYLEALRRYNTNSIVDLLDARRDATSPRQAVEALLLAFAEQAGQPAASACLGVNSICEFGTSDGDVVRINHESGQTLQRFLERNLREAQQQGEVDRSLDTRGAAQFIAVTLMGMKVSARAGADTATLRNIAQMALRSLDGPP